MKYNVDYNDSWVQPVNSAALHFLLSGFVLYATKKMVVFAHKKVLGLQEILET